MELSIRSGLVTEHDLVPAGSVDLRAVATDYTVASSSANGIGDAVFITSQLPVARVLVGLVPVAWVLQSDE